MSKMKEKLFRKSVKMVERKKTTDQWIIQPAPHTSKSTPIRSLGFQPCHLNEHAHMLTKS